MNFLYKIRNFQRVLDEKTDIEKQYKNYKKKSEGKIAALENKNQEQLKEISKQKNINTKQLEEISKLKIENEDLADKLAKANTSKGGLTKENNKLKKQNEELNLKLKEQEIELSKRFIVKTVKPGRTPNTIKTKISKPMSNNVRNYMKKEFDY
jgi:hypothetical protein